MAKRAKKRATSAKTKSAAGGHVSAAGYSSYDYSLPEVPDYVVVELKYENPVAYTDVSFAGPTEAESTADRLNKILSKFNVTELRNHFGQKNAAVRRRSALAGQLPTAASASKLEASGVDTEFIHSGFVEVVPTKSADAAKIAKLLNDDDSVWEAYVAPRPIPAISGSQPGSRNFEPAQGYLHSAPNGIGAIDAWSLAGGKGDGVTICDLEGNWQLSHEDLPRGIKLIGGTVINDLGWRNHGTAVLGEMVSLPNKFGTVGISHEAKAVVQSAIINGVFNTAGALMNAANRLKAGDVILIELHAKGPNDKYVAMQYWNDVFSAIVAATAKGITVVEAAGNGNENFDLPIFRNTGLQKDSGAIVVGAGIPPTNYFDFPNSYASIGVPRSRIWFSNYGKIVNVQAWGWHVTTLGYGDAQGGSSEDHWYTHRFSGTSSASPIVTGAVACLQGRSLNKNGQPLLPSKIRQILMNTGTPQVAGPGVPLSQQIGPQPNLSAAIKQV
jgi:subtilisin family serine protease